MVPGRQAVGRSQASDRSRLTSESESFAQAAQPTNKEQDCSTTTAPWGAAQQVVNTRANAQKGLSQCSAPDKTGEIGQCTAANPEEETDYQRGREAQSNTI